MTLPGMYWTRQQRMTLAAEAARDILRRWCRGELDDWERDRAMWEVAQRYGVGPDGRLLDEAQSAQK